MLHHCSNFSLLMDDLIKKMPKLKYLYIFDSYLRESHQFPDDFCRYTTSALDVLLADKGFKNIYKKEIGNAFDAILYFISQSEKILEHKDNLQLKKIINKLIPLLKDKNNLKKWRGLRRKHASLSTAYSMFFKKNKS